VLAFAYRLLLVLGCAKHFFAPPKFCRVAKTVSLFNPSGLRMSPTFKNAADQGPVFQQESSEGDWLWQRAAAGEPRAEEGVTHLLHFSACLAHQPMQKGMQGSTAALLLPRTAPGCLAAPIPPLHPAPPVPLMPQDSEVVPALRLESHSHAWGRKALLQESRWGRK